SKRPASGQSVGGPWIGAVPDFCGLLQGVPGLFWKRPISVDRSCTVTLASTELPYRRSTAESLPHQTRRAARYPKAILAVATQGSGGDDESRLLGLLAAFSVELFPFNRRHKLRSFRRLFKTILRRRPELLVMEGTGLGGGLALLLGRLLAGVPYVVSSGDAVGPFVAGQRPWLGPLSGLYERLLCRWSAGYIGWTPYLAGRA